MNYRNKALIRWAVVLATAGIGILAVCEVDKFDKNRTQKRLNAERAKVIGISHQLDDIKNISPPRDYNQDSLCDYLVDFKDGRTKIFYNQGFK